MKGEETLIIIHVEPQSYFQKEFHERMFIYFSRLYEKYRKPILPIAIFSYNDNREIADTFTISFPTHKIKITSLPEDEEQVLLKFPNSYFEKGIKKGIELVVNELIRKGLAEDFIVDVTKHPIDQVREIKLKMDRLS